MSKLRFLTLLVAPVVLVLGLSMAGLRVNISNSVPYGLYWQGHMPTTIERDMLVRVHVEGWTIRPIKPVAAVAGEFVCRLNDELWIAGESYGPVHAHVPAVMATNGCLTVPPAHIFLASRASWSYDSRYFGPVETTRIDGVVRPLLTW